MHVLQYAQQYAQERRKEIENVPSQRQDRWRVKGPLSPPLHEGDSCFLLSKKADVSSVSEPVGPIFTGERKRESGVICTGIVHWVNQGCSTLRVSNH